MKLSNKIVSLVLDLKPNVVSEPERKNQARFPVQGARRSPLAVMDLFRTQYNCTDEVIIRCAILLLTNPGVG